MRTGHFLKNSKNYLNSLATQFLNIFKDREMFHVFVYEGLGSAENLKIKVTQRYQFVVIRGGNILNMR